MDFETQVREWIDGAAKPVNSLGLLEEHLKKIVMSWGEIKPELKPYHLVFAADNGVVEEGVAQTPQEVTYLQAQNMVAGKATISCFCQSNRIDYGVADVGINSMEPFNGFRCKVALGTKNFIKEEAMSRSEFEQAWQASQELVRELVQERGYNMLSFGEMGIGNTTTSAAVMHGLTGILPEFVVGYGAGVERTELLKHKRQIVAKGVALHKEKLQTPQEVLRCLGGFDLVAICAGMLECAKLRTPFVIDGFITAVAYACASRIAPEIEKHAIPSHMSKEPGMAYALLMGNIVSDSVFIRANMGLGEGTGAVLMVSIMKTMLYTMHHMARFSELTSLEIPGNRTAVEVQEKIVVV